MPTAAVIPTMPRARTVPNPDADDCAEMAAAMLQDAAAIREGGIAQPSPAQFEYDRLLREAALWIDLAKVTRDQEI